jgi:hypothetical protein
VLVAKQLTADRAGEQILAGVGAGSEPAEDGSAEGQRIDGEGLWNGKRAMEASV